MKQRLSTTLFFILICISLLKAQQTNSQSPKKLAPVLSAASGFKRAILQKATDTFYLTHMGGFVGANAFIDTDLNEGIWTSGGSSIEAGERVGYDNTLTKEDIDLLNSIRIEFDTTLTIRFMVGNKELLKSNYIVDGMDYKIKDTSATVLEDFLKEDNLKNVNPSTIFYDKKILLLAADKINFENDIQGNFYGVLSDYLLLTYDPVNKFFEIHIFQGLCCDNGTMTFEKRQS